MIVSQDVLQKMLWDGGGSINAQTPLFKAHADTGTELAKEWANPSAMVATVLMFVSGNVIQEAFAQSTGKLFTPVCFSFGWVSYALSNLKDIFGEGRLMPLPDYPVKVFNVASGYYRVNKNWLIGRIVRDHESSMSKLEPLNDCGIRIAIFEAMPVTKRKLLSFRYNTRHLLGAVVMLTQFAIASIPTIRTEGHEWGILAITGFGTLLAIIMGSLPQWLAEKVPSNRASDKVFALTVGNGSRDIMIIKGEGRCLDLEELATLASPRTARPWTKMETFSLARRNSLGRDAKMMLGKPLGFLITRCVCVFEALGWLLILISVAGIRSHTWCLITIGAIGLIHNAMLADLERKPGTRNLPLKLLDSISTHKVMDGLMDLEITHEGCGEALLQEFFPGRLRPDEEQWWKTEKGKRSNTKYDQKRLKEGIRRHRPRSMFPKYNLHATPGSPVSTTAPDLDPSNALDQALSGAAGTPARKERPPFISVTGSNPTETSQQPRGSFVDDHLYHTRSLGAARRQSLTQSHRGSLSYEARGLVEVSQHSKGEPTLKDIANEMPKRPYWD